MLVLLLAVDWEMSLLNSRHWYGKVSVEQQIQPEDEAFLFIAPSAVEVAQVEKLCEAGSRPVVLFNRLEDVSIIGIGYAGRQLRDRFLNAIESCSYPTDSPISLLSLSLAGLARNRRRPADYRTAKPVGGKLTKS